MSTQRQRKLLPPPQAAPVNDAMTAQNVVTAPGPASMAVTAAAADDLVELEDLLETTASGYPRALEMLQRAWAARRSRGEPASPLSETADALILHRQGRVYKGQGKFDEALAHYQQALEIRTRVLGHEHADVAASYNNIGVVYKGQGKLDEALAQHQKSLEIAIRVLGHEHKNVADSKYNVALLHKKRNEMKKARQLFLECEQIYAKVHGPSHSKTVDATRQAGWCV